MKLNATFEPGFDKLYSKFASDPVGLKMLNLDGISPRKVDVGQMSHDYFTKRLADASVDVNANANEELSANNYQAEVTKGILKLEGYYLLWRYSRKRFGIRRANELIKAIWDGSLYFHDASGSGVQMGYCISYSTANLMIDGRKYGQLHSLPPNRSDSFVAQVIESTMDLSQEFVGAVAPGDFIVNLCWYLEREGVDPNSSGGRKYIENLWQKFVHVMNNKFRVSGQSPFTNISLFDRDNINKLFGDYCYPDGSKVKPDYIMDVQKVVAEFFSKGDPTTGLPYRFPVITANLSVDENRVPTDAEFMDFVARTNTGLGVYNIYANEGSKIAMCPVAADEEVVTRNSSGVFKSKIGTLGQRGKSIYEILYQGKFVKGKFMKVPYTDFIEITLSNGHKFVTTDNHLNLTQRGTLMSRDLQVGDLLPFNLKPYSGKGGMYDMGYFIGAYLGDGCLSDKVVTISLNNSTKLDAYHRLRGYLENVLGAVTRTYEKDKVLNLVTSYSTVKGVIEQFVWGKNALEKGIKPCVYGKSMEFRQGVLDGYLATDGGNKQRIYTASKRMVGDLSALVASMGNVTNIKLKDDREGRLGNSTVYCIKIYDRNGLQKRSYGDVWKKDESGDMVWFYITDLRKIKKTNTTQAYCFEVQTEDHLFQLANGLITHNCRFINDTERMRYRADSFGNGGVNIGSHRVVTINFPRIALEAQTLDEFYRILDKRAKMARDLLLVHREEILRRRVERGFLKFFEPLKWFKLDMLFSTIGVHGLYEMCHFMGIPMESWQGQNFTEDILKRIDGYAVDFSTETGHSFNTEEIPAESTAVTLAKKDRVLFEKSQPFALYSNQYIPLIADMGAIDRIKLTGRFMKYVSGGGILHLNVQDRVTNPETMRKLILMSLKEGIEHFAVNYGFGICVNDHTSIVGNGKTCPICGEPIEDYLTRVIGYFSKTSSWGDVRKDYEYPRRKFNQSA